MPWEGDPADFIINITNDENEVLSIAGFNYMLPRWAHEKMQQQLVEALVNTTAIDFELPLVGREGTVALSEFKGEPTLIYSVLIDGEQKIQEVVYGSIPVDELRRRLE